MNHGGVDVTADELCCISSAAFVTYAFDPEINQHEEERREYSPHAELFSNYGPWTAIGRYTGWEIREVAHLSPVETMKVVAFELASGRPIVTLGEDLLPRLITSYEVDLAQKRVVTADGASTDLDERKLQGDDEVFRNWMLLVRPGEVPEWTAPRSRQRVDVLRWAHEHAHNQKEFFQETRENYQPGLRGVARFSEMLADVRDPGTAQFAERFVVRMARARRAAANTLLGWAPTIAEALGDDDVLGPLEDLRATYGEVADALEEDRPLLDAMSVVGPLEERAVAALDRLRPHLPSAFEA